MFHKPEVSTSVASFSCCFIGVRGEEIAQALTTCASCIRRQSLSLIGANKQKLPDTMSDIQRLVDAANTKAAAYRSNGRRQDLDNAISLFRSAVANTPAENTIYPHLQALLADAHSLRAEYLHSEEDLNQAIALYTEALRRTPLHAAEHPELLSELGQLRNFEHEWANASADNLRQAHAMFLQAVELTQQYRPNDSKLAKYMMLQADVLRRLYTDGARTNQQLLDSCISLFDQALALPNFQPKNDWAPKLLAWCSFALLLRSRTDPRFDVEANRAVEIAKQAVEETQNEVPMKGLCLSFLLICQYQMYNYRARPEDLDEAIRAGQLTMGLLPEDHARWNTLVGNLAKLLVDRYQARGSVDDLNQAIRCLRDTLNILPPDSRHRPARFWALGNALIESYVRRGQTLELDQAIEAYREAVRLAPTGDHEEGWYMQYLGSALVQRYMDQRKSADLDEAIPVLTDAVAFADNAKLSSARADLAYAYTILFRRNGSLLALEQAISLFRDAVQGARQKSELPLQYSMFGVALTERWFKLGIRDDLSEAIHMHKEAVQLASSGSSGHSLMDIFLTRLGAAQRLRYDILHEYSDLADSLRHLKEATRITPSGHPLLASCYYELGCSLYSQYNATKEMGHLQEAISALHVAMNDEKSVPRHRLNAAMWCADALFFVDPPSAVEAYRLAIKLLPGVAWLGLDQAARYQALQWTPLAGHAAACAISTGQLELAVELLEEGRSVLWNQSLQLRQEEFELHSVAPELAAELSHVGRALEISLSRSTAREPQDPRESERAAQRHRRLADKWASLVQEVRRIPRFERFLLPASYGSLRMAASEGPVVLINTSAYRCDALIITMDQPVRLVPLPAVQEKALSNTANYLQDALRTTKDAKGAMYAEAFLLDTLDRLWEDIGAPIWDELRGLVPPGGPHRVWLVPTGALASLPIHAAGPLNDPNCGFPSLIVASYTTTLSALIRARSSTNHDPTSFRMLAVSQPFAPGKAPLPDSPKEIDALWKYIPWERTSHLSAEEATVAAVTTELQTHNFLHFCSHGEQDFQNPYHSSLALFDGPLRLSDIIQLRLRAADFAFLSACHTARVDPQSPDESVHIASGLHLAGFRSLIATLWGIADIDGPMMAQEVYGYLTAGGTRTPVHTNSAEALHYAVHVLRKDRVPAFRWVPFIHIGV